MKIKCIIIDDEFPARSLLKEYISKVPFLELTGSFQSALDALSTLQNNTPYLLFIDIEMPDITGIDFLKTLSNKPLTIITTAFQEYALEGYNLDVLDYLLKPYPFERFMQAINKAVARLQPTQTPVTKTPVADENTPPANNHVLLIKADHKTYRLKTDQILCIEGMREYVTFHCITEKILTLESLRNLETQLPTTFLRVHKSYIINTDKISAFSGHQIHLNGLAKPIPIGKSFKSEVNERLMKG